MKKITPTHFLFVIFLFIQITAVAQKAISILCINNYNAKQEAYPAQLQQLLGSGYEVKSLGLARAYEDALNTRPTCIIIQPDINDGRLQVDSFIADYKTWVRTFQEVSKRIILLTDTTPQSAIANLVRPRIKELAYEQNVEVLDLHNIATDTPAIIAKRLYETITRKNEFDYNFYNDYHPWYNIIRTEFKISNFHGYHCGQFTFNGRKAIVVRPKIAAKGKPWIWRARFWGVEPQTDIALLERGFHVVYCDVAELFGNAEAIDIWNKFYKKMKRGGLAKKVCLEGFSRGGIYVYNWAAQNPDKVACVYVDAPVLDLKSWPGGKGSSKGSAKEWETFKKDYGYTSDSAAMTFKGNPIDKVEQIVKGGYPMLHVVGDADDVVPVAENTAIFEQKVLALGGKIQMIHKPGVNHHPHSLADPTPIVEFILKATGRN